LKETNAQFVNSKKLFHFLKPSQCIIYGKRKSVSKLYREGKDKDQYQLVDAAKKEEDIEDIFCSG